MHNTLGSWAHYLDEDIMQWLYEDWIYEGLNVESYMRFFNEAERFNRWFINDIPIAPLIIGGH